MGDDSVFNTSPDDMDNFLSEIWSNADLEPPPEAADAENVAVEEETLAEASKLCTQAAQRPAGSTGRENFAEGRKLCSMPGNKSLAMKQESAEHYAGCENFVMKEEIFTEFCTMVCSTRESVARGGGLVNNQSRRRRNAGGPSQFVDGAETRRRRMIKNRASAARSRARNVVRLANLELEVKQYKEENAMLRQKKQRASEPGSEKAQPRADRKLRRCKSCRW